MDGKAGRHHALALPARDDDSARAGRAAALLLRVRRVCLHRLRPVLRRTATHGPLARRPSAHHELSRRAARDRRRTDRALHHRPRRLLTALAAQASRMGGRARRIALRQAARRPALSARVSLCSRVARAGRMHRCGHRKHPARRRGLRSRRLSDVPARDGVGTPKPRRRRGATCPHADVFRDGTHAGRTRHAGRHRPCWRGAWRRGGNDRRLAASGGLRTARRHARVRHHAGQPLSLRLRSRDALARHRLVCARRHRARLAARGARMARRAVAHPRVRSDRRAAPRVSVHAAHHARHARHAVAPPSPTRSRAGNVRRTRRVPCRCPPARRRPTAPAPTR